MHFGGPVVPEEYRIAAGWSNGVRVYSSTPAPADASSAKEIAPGTSRRSGSSRRFPVTTTLRTRGECRTDLDQPRQAVERPTAVRVAVRGEQHDGIDLPESVDDTGCAEVGRRRGEDRADRVRREERDHGLGQVRHPRRDTIPGLHVGLPKPGDDRGHRHAELPPSHRAPLPVLALEDDRRHRVVARPIEQVLGEAERRLGEEASAEHRLVAGSNATDPGGLTTPHTSQTSRQNAPGSSTLHAVE